MKKNQSKSKDTQSQSMQKKNIVVVGGGNGTACTVRGLKAYADEIHLSAVVSMSDSGGSSGRLRDEFKSLPVGDIMRATLALSKHKYHDFLKPMFYKTRFEGVGKLDGHNIGNLFLILASQYAGSLPDAISALHQSLECLGNAYPVTLERCDLIAELTDGTEVRSEDELDRPKYNRSLRIKKAWLDPVPKLYDKAKKAIEQAEFILMGPGSLYCSVIATLLPKGMKEAIASSSAQLVYIAGNAFERIGETGPTILSECASELEVYLPRKLDVILYNGHELTNDDEQAYKEKGWELIQQDIDPTQEPRLHIHDYETKRGLCAESLAEFLITLIRK
jgi:uncharacterized cofD-like protein